MKSISVLCAHYKNWKWLPIAIHSLRQYGFSGIPFEILVCDNSPHHPSIKTLTETELGKEVKIIQGDPDLPSHGQGYSLCYEQAGGSHLFTIETDSYAMRHGWFEPYIKASVNYDYIGPRMALAGGNFIHPCGALCSRDVVERAKLWRKDHASWIQAQGAAITLGLSDQAYHVTIHQDLLAQKVVPIELTRSIDTWKKAGPWQCMDSFDDDSFKTYGQRKEIAHWSPHGSMYHLRIGYEPGQHLAYFADKYARTFAAPHRVDWIPGWEGRQAAQSVIFDGLCHAWAGTSAVDCEGLHETVRSFKRKQMEECFLQLPEGLRQEILELEKKYA